jgi:hypothetical protein
VLVLLLVLLLAAPAPVPTPASAPDPALASAPTPTLAPAPAPARAGEEAGGGGGGSKGERGLRWPPPPPAPPPPPPAPPPPPPPPPRPPPPPPPRGGGGGSSASRALRWHAPAAAAAAAAAAACQQHENGRQRQHWPFRAVQRERGPRSSILQRTRTPAIPITAVVAGQPVTHEQAVRPPTARYTRRQFKRHRQHKRARASEFSRHPSRHRGGPETRAGVRGCRASIQRDAAPNERTPSSHRQNAASTSAARAACARAAEYLNLPGSKYEGGVSGARGTCLYTAMLFFWWRGLIHSKGARTSAASAPCGRAPGSNGPSGPRRRKQSRGLGYAFGLLSRESLPRVASSVPKKRGSALAIADWGRGRKRI